MHCTSQQEMRKGSLSTACRGEKKKQFSNFSILSQCQCLYSTGHSCRRLMWGLVMNVFHKQTSRANAAAVILGYSAVYWPFLETALFLYHCEFAAATRTSLISSAAVVVADEGY